MSAGLPASQLIGTLGLQPHPEGGWYRETFRDDASTVIYYLLEAGQVSAWHRVRNAVEVWHHYVGGPLKLSLAAPDGPARSLVLGPDVIAGQSPQLIVPKGWWQAAEPLGAWTLAGCTVAPAFEFASFELAPQGWSPPTNPPP